MNYAAVVFSDIRQAFTYDFHQPSDVREIVVYN
jgi:hypothetical protein